MAAGSEFELKPVDWYSAACVHALNGEIEAGIAALARCAELQNSPDVDVSHHSAGGNPAAQPGEIVTATHITSQLAAVYAQPE